MVNIMPADALLIDIARASVGVILTVGDHNFSRTVLKVSVMAHKLLKFLTNMKINLLILNQT